MSLKNKEDIKFNTSLDKNFKLSLFAHLLMSLDKSDKWNPSSVTMQHHHRHTFLSSLHATLCVCVCVGVSIPMDIYILCHV